MVRLVCIQLVKIITSTLRTITPSNNCYEDVDGRGNDDNFVDGDRMNRDLKQSSFVHI